MKKRFYRENLLSIIIPTCRKAKYLNITLASIYAQDYDKKNLEVIVAIDDASCKDTFKVIEFWKNYLNINSI
jgi:glycosyltransferase involved in cell wall biosynthesis